VSPPILLLIGLFLVVAIAGGVVAVGQLDAASGAQVRLTVARDDLDALLRTQLAEETGLRGFIATHERNFLEPEAPGETFDDHADALARDLPSLNIPDGTTLASDLRTSHHSWETDVEAPLLQNPNRADALEKQTYSKLLTDRMRQDANTLRQRLNDAAGYVEVELRRRVNATVASSVGIIAIFAIVSLSLGLSRARAVQALVHEQSLVAALQQTLRVEGVQLPRTSVGWAYTSATREALVGGDLIDTWRADANRGWFLIADASGKGVEAARHSAFVQYAIRTIAAEISDPAEVLGRFNRLFIDTFDEPSSFVVLFLGTFDARSGIMRYANAGHSAAFVMRRDGSIEQLAPTGPIIGIDRDEVYVTREERVRSGETIVLATDGLTESRDQTGDLLGDEGVIALLRDTPGEPQVICNRLVAEVERRSGGEVKDDLAILALRVLAVDDESEPATFSTMGTPEAT